MAPYFLVGPCTCPDPVPVQCESEDRRGRPPSQDLQLTEWLILSNQGVGEVGLSPCPHQLVHVLRPPNHIRDHRQIHSEESVKRRIQISQNVTQHRYWKIIKRKIYLRNTCFYKSNLLISTPKILWSYYMEMFFNLFFDQHPVGRVHNISWSDNCQVTDLRTQWCGTSPSPSDESSRQSSSPQTEPGCPVSPRTPTYNNTIHHHHSKQSQATQATQDLQKHSFTRISAHHHHSKQSQDSQDNPWTPTYKW